VTRSWRAERRLRARIRAALLGVAVMVALLPLLWTTLAAIGLEPDNDSRPPAWIGVPSLDHLAEVSVVEPDFWEELATSVGVSAAAAILATAVSFLAGYGIARSMSPALRRLSPALLVLASLPVMAYVLPLSELLRRAGFLDTLPGLTFAEAAATAPLAVYVLSAHLAGTSRDTEAAARLEGASLWRLLRDVVLPTAAPIVAATAIILFVLDWNMLLIPLVLTGIDVRTLPVILTDFFTLEREVDWPTAAAALAVSLLPVLVLVGVLFRLLDRFRLGGDATEPA